ncbi:MAG: hypothetical protein HY321_04190 [Armatimonadetes bacterium]|nr:hypothetical protein [Armatimonadota bacterium]
MVVDNGNAAAEPRKSALVLRVMAMDGYHAVGTGDLDIRLGDAFAREASRNKIPLVRAFPRGDALDALTKPLAVQHLKGRAIGTTAVPPMPAGEDAGAYIDKAAQALRKLRGQCDFLVLLSQLGLDADKDLARRCGGSGPNVIIGNLEARELKEPLKIGEATLLPTGPGAVQVGMFDVVFPALGQPRMERFAILPTRSAEAGDKAIEFDVKEYFAAEQQQFTKGMGAWLKEEIVPGTAGDVQRCGRCHAKEARRWKQTRHATAMKSLAKGTRVVPECIACHSTRYRNKKVFDRAAHVGGVECTSCHVIAADREASDCPERATPTRGEHTCVPCHTAANSPHFSYQLYLPKVNHTRDLPKDGLPPPPMPPPPPDE